MQCSIWKKLSSDIFQMISDTVDYRMSKCFPTGEFKWIDPKELDFNKYTSNSSKGYFLEVYLKYPK